MPEKQNKKPAKPKVESSYLTKCTPLDRNIKATTRLMFEQLKSIKQEVKKETNETVDKTTKKAQKKELKATKEKVNVVTSSLEDLEIPDLNLDITGSARTGAHEFLDDETSREKPESAVLLQHDDKVNASEGERDKGTILKTVIGIMNRETFDDNL